MVFCNNVISVTDCENQISDPEQLKIEGNHFNMEHEYWPTLHPQGWIKRGFIRDARIWMYTQ